MMKDPKFQAEMKRYTSSPAYKTAMSRASEDIEVIDIDSLSNTHLDCASLNFILHPITEPVERPSALKEARSRLRGKDESLKPCRKKSTRLLQLIFPFIISTIYIILPKQGIDQDAI